MISGWISVWNQTHNNHEPHGGFWLFFLNPYQMMLTQTFNNKLDERKWISVRHLSETIMPTSHFLPLFGLLVSSSLPACLCAGGPICVQALSVHGSGILPAMIPLWCHESRQWGDLIKKGIICCQLSIWPHSSLDTENKWQRKTSE